MRVKTTDGLVVDLAAEYPKTNERLERLEREETADLAGETVEAGPFAYELVSDPQGELKEALLRNAQGEDPAPDVPDEALWAEWTKHREAESG